MRALLRSAAAPARAAGAKLGLALCALVAAALAWPPAALAEPMQLNVDGRARTYLLERPPGAGPKPTIIALHGFSGSGARIAQQTGLDRLGPGAGFVAVFPDGLRNRWNFYRPGTEPNRAVEDWRPHGGLPDDVAFVKQLVGDLERRGVADPKRIHIVGLSNGSFLALRLICDEAGMIASAALLVGGMPESLGADCRPARPIPVLMVNGTADVVVPYRGGPVQPGGNFSAWPTERLVDFLRRVDGCTGNGERSQLPARAGHQSEITRWTNCSGAPFAFHRVLDVGHDAAENLDIGPLLVEFFRSSASEGPPPERATSPLKRVRYRRYDGSMLVTGEVERSASGAWIETNTRGSRWTFRTVSESGVAVVLHDVSRDVYLKIDLTTRKLLVAMGTQAWAVLAEIVATEP